MHRGPLPPKSPTPGMMWRTGRVTYEWREGRGWVEPAPEPAIPVKASEHEALRAAHRKSVTVRKTLERPAQPEPVPAAPPRFERECRAFAELLATVRFIATLPQPAPPPPPPPAPLAPPEPVEVAPRYQPPVKDISPSHPVLARHAGHREPPADPLAKRPREKPAAPEPQWSPEFQAQLDKVAAGAGIREEPPMRRAEPLYTLGGVAESGI